MSAISEINLADVLTFTEYINFILGLEICSDSYHLDYCFDKSKNITDHIIMCIDKLCTMGFINKIMCYPNCPNNWTDFKIKYSPVYKHLQNEYTCKLNKIIVHSKTVKDWLKIKYPIQYAIDNYKCIYSNYNIVKYMLDMGARCDKDYDTTGYMCALINECAGKYLETTQYYVKQYSSRKNNKNHRQFEKQYKDTIFEQQKLYYNFAKLLIDHNCDININRICTPHYPNIHKKYYYHNNKPISTLACACRTYNPQLFQLLLTNGMCINQPDNLFYELSNDISNDISIFSQKGLVIKLQENKILQEILNSYTFMCYHSKISNPKFKYYANICIEMWHVAFLNGIEFYPYNNYCEVLKDETSYYHNTLYVMMQDFFHQEFYTLYHLLYNQIKQLILNITIIPIDIINIIENYSIEYAFIDMIY